MKKIVKKNQVIITSLAILIAIAGYLNYSERSVLNQTGKEIEEAEVVNDVIKNEKSNKTDEENVEEKSDIAENGSDNPNVSQENTQEPIIEGSDENTTENTSENTSESSPGEAVLTNISTFSANAKLQREQLRAKNKEMMMDMINNQNLSESQKSDVTKEMLHMTEIAEMENEVETLLEAKGFNGAVVTIDDESVDVVINMVDVSDKERAQIEDVVKRKTNVSVSNIIITPISVEN